MMTAYRYTLWVAVTALVPVLARAQRPAPASASQPAPARRATNSDGASAAVRATGAGHRSVAAPKMRSIGLQKPATVRSSQSLTRAPRPSALEITAHPAGVSQAPSVPRPLPPMAGLGANRSYGIASAGNGRVTKVSRPTHPLPPAGLVPSTIQRHAPNLVSLSGASVTAPSKDGTVALDGASVHQRRSNR